MRLSFSGLCGISNLAGGILVILAGVFIYHSLLFPADPELIYPWASDTWGHLIKVIYLEQQIAQGNYYPDLFPAWYNGLQALRYHAPLPYYLMVGLLRVSGDIWWTGNLFLFLTAVGGGLSFLLYRRWLGWFPAVLGGVLFMGLPDNLRVAFAEGNLPRVLATSLLPLTFYFVLRLTLFQGRRRDFAGVVAGIGLMVLAHAMMAAIFLVGCGLFVICFCFSARRSFRVVSCGALALGTGLLVSGWWLLPSLTGGITEIDQEAASEALAVFPISISLNPVLRSANREAYYLGLSLVAGLGLALVYWRRLDPWARSLALTALITGLVSSTMLSDLYNALPFHQLFWPIRFLSFAGFAMLLTTMAAMAWLWNQTRSKLGGISRYQWAGLAMLIFLVLDFTPSLNLVRGREIPADLARFSSRLNDLPGWRVATADLSRLGSAPSYLFTSPGNREQVFGWAYQGSVTAPLLARINQAMVSGYSPYALDRLSLLGADDVVVLRQADIPGEFVEALQGEGYRLDLDAGDLELYHRDGVPRAYTIPHRALGIGRGAHNLALIFPEVVVGGSALVDDYDQEFLNSFDTLFLSGFKWRNKDHAEQRVKDFLAQGGRKVVVDLEGAPREILSKQPKFLGVYGEPVLAIEQASLTIDGKAQTLLPFSQERRPWITQAPQGLDEIIVPFNYPVSGGVALGVKRWNGQPVHFVGLNLVYHALLTHDPVAVGLLEDTLGLRAGKIPERQTIKLDQYRAGESGYSFEYRLSRDTEALIPIARHEGARVYIDGRPVPSRGVDQLVLTTLTAGAHRVEIRSEEVPVYLAGKIATVAGLAILAAYAVAPLVRRAGHYLRRRREAASYAAH